MKFSKLLTSTLVTTGIVLGAVAAPAFAQGRPGGGGGRPGGGGGGGGASACPTVGGTPLCLGAFDGNDTGAQGTAIANLDASMPNMWWMLAGKSDDPFGTFTEGGHGDDSGVWETGLSGAGAFSVKAGPAYLLFKTDDISTINWSTLGLLNNGGQQPGLSHLSVYTGTSHDVPEPLTMMGSAVALGFGGMFQKKRNAKKSAK
jgi:hypothetical protein